MGKEQQFDTNAARHGLLYVCDESSRQRVERWHRRSYAQLTRKILPDEYHFAFVEWWFIWEQYVCRSWYFKCIINQRMIGHLIVMMLMAY